MKRFHNILDTAIRILLYSSNVLILIASRDNIGLKRIL